MIKDILVHVDGKESDQCRIAYAFEVAEHHRARLTGLQVTTLVDVPPYYKPSMVRQVETMLEQQSEQQAEMAAALFQTAAAQHAVEVSWQTSTGNLAHEICSFARWSDLVIIGQQDQEGTAEHHPFPLAKDVAQTCGRPVLVVPPQVDRGIMRRVLIAWDGSREVVRAVHDALPLLRQARSNVELVTLEEQTSPAHLLQPLLDHLRRHQIRIQHGVHQCTGDSMREMLKEHIEGGHFDLLVMGACSQPTWFEFLLGDATSLDIMVPMLISH